MGILKKLLIAVAVVVIVVALAILVAGFFVPAERSFTNEVDINAPAEKVWQVITDKARYTEWQTQLERVEITGESEWIEYPKNSPEPLRFNLEYDGRPGEMVFGYMMGETVYGSWTGTMTPTTTGVRLRTVDSYRTKSWLTKIMIGAFFDLDAFAKDWNSRLKQRVEALNR